MIVRPTSRIVMLNAQVANNKRAMRIPLRKRLEQLQGVLFSSRLKLDKSFGEEASYRWLKRFRSRGPLYSVLSRETRVKKGESHRRSAVVITPTALTAQQAS